MAFNIDEFKANIQSGGLLQTNRFDVLIVPPAILRNQTINTGGNSVSVTDTVNIMRYRCESVRVPGVNLQLTPNQRYGIGPTQNFVHNVEFKDTQISMIADGFGDIWQFWYAWLREAFQFTGTNQAIGGVGSNQQPTYTSRYKDEYAATMAIIVYDTFGNGVLEFVLNQAFPYALDEVALNWGEQNNLVRLNIGITFKDFTIVGSAMEAVQQAARFNAQADQSIIISR